MATERGTPARSKFRTAVRRRSWNSRPGTPAAAQAVAHVFRKDARETCRCCFAWGLGRRHRTGDNVSGFAGGSDALGAPGTALVGALGGGGPSIPAAWASRIALTAASSSSSCSGGTQSTAPPLEPTGLPVL